MKVALGKLSSAHLGVRITGMPGQRTIGVPKPTGPVTGVLESIHHCRVDGEDRTHAIVRVGRTPDEVKRRVAEYREIGGLSTTEVEVPE